MASLKELIAEEGTRHAEYHRNRRRVKSRDRISSSDSIVLPIYICHGRKSFDFSTQKSDKTPARNGSSVFSSEREDSKSKRSNSKSFKAEGLQNDEPAIDEAAIRAVISILTGYVGRFSKDRRFRETLRANCYSCMVIRKEGLDDGVLAKIEVGIKNVERVAENHETTKELKIKSLQSPKQLLSSVASLNSRNAKNASHLSACAELYLSIVYKLEKNDSVSASHLLQVFSNSPFLARTHLLPDLWEHFFLPHLLHLKIWYGKEAELVLSLDSRERERRMKTLSKVYNDKMDMGTSQFALYYKEWLRVGARAPPIPSVPLPSSPNYGLSGKKVSMSSLSPGSAINENLYQAVFGRTHERKSLELEDGRNGYLNDEVLAMAKEERASSDENNFKLSSSVHSLKGGGDQRSLIKNCKNAKTELGPRTKKTDYFRLLPCRNETATSLLRGSHMFKNEIIHKEENSHIPPSNLSTAISTICTSDSLSDCEIAIRVLAKAWLDSNGDLATKTKLFKAPLIEGLIEVLFTSEDNEILELSISILAELVARNEMNSQIILNSDPQLEIFMRLLRSTSLFLKASVLLYLLKPKAKQMLSIEWVPLVLRVLEFGDQLQILFTIRCSPQEAAFYLLGQLLTGFDEDRNVENAMEVVSLGGLSLLIQRLEKGDTLSRMNAASIISCCIQADRSCRHYLADNLKKSCIIELLVLGNRSRSGNSECVLSLLIELVCLHRRTQVNKFLNGLKNEGGIFNIMHILLVYLQQAPLEQRPLVAAILLQLDLLGDPLQCSVYREEAVDAIVASLECKTSDKIQEQSGRALLLLGGRFSYMGKSSVETWLLNQAGFDESSEDSFHGKEIVVDQILESNEEDEATEDWQWRTASALLTSGSKRFLIALSKCIANGMPCLAWASMVTVAWLSSLLSSIQDASLQSMACLILVPRLLECLNYDKALEERVLASLSLMNLIKNSECVSMVSRLDKELIGPLRNLTLVTWTAEQLLSIAAENSNYHQYPDLEIMPQ
ncbi:putative E3 ubiquitin-protein ligase LIN-1 [Macadamia integrifolia]|uniref:putative E3 ubiquitin-protein ligase LIN-1 n=1 Tax=Macadamia integrifolia TaxID=60698 RepID=UPI001C530853|nr:putative E3 ubiquitin-protein ligase LIN-1 [Macadamia integrifolia]